MLKAEEVIIRLHSELGLAGVELTALAGADEEPLLRSIVAGQIDELWAVNDRGNVEHIFTGKERELSSSSVVRHPKLVAGTPFDLQVPTRSGNLETLRLVTGATVVDTDWLVELAPQLFAGRRGTIVYDPRIGGLAERQQVRFGKRVLEGRAVPIVEDSSHNRKLFVREYAKWAHQQIKRQHWSLSRFQHGNVPKVQPRQVEQEVKRLAGGVVSLNQLNSDAKRQLLALSKIETFIGDDFLPKSSKRLQRKSVRQSKRRKGLKDSRGGRSKKRSKRY